MAFKKFLKYGLLLTLGGHSAWSAAQETPATVPASFHGTYELTFDFVANQGSPVKQGTRSTFVIAPGGVLCVDGRMLQNPVFRGSNTVEGIWKDSANLVEYAISNFNGSFNEVNLMSTTGVFHGQYSGSRVSSDTTCTGGGGNTGAVTISSAAQAMFELAEELYPGVFGQGSELRSAQGFVYRYFASSGIHVGIKDGDVYVRGAQFGNAITRKGTIAQIAGGLEKTRQARANAGTGGNTGGAPGGIPGSIDGDYTLTVTGRYTTSFISIDIPRIVLEGLPAPDPGDSRQILEPFTAAMGSSAAVDDSSVQVVVINNTAERVTFDVSVAATLTGLGRVNYDLRYDYVRQ